MVHDAVVVDDDVVASLEELVDERRDLFRAVSVDEGCEAAGVREQH
jgi:hypothetical protein